MTPADIEAVLPRDEAGLSSGDLTKTDRRWAFAERLALIVSAAGTCEQPDDIDLDGPGVTPVGSNGGESMNEKREDEAIARAHQASQRLRGEGPRHGDRWESRLDTDGHYRAVIVASNDWPPPRKGEHESDLCRRVGFLPHDGIPRVAKRGGNIEYWIARDWSRSK